MGEATCATAAEYGNVLAMPSQPYIVIMAGGRGERLWPFSTRSHPKQFLQFNGPSFLQITVAQITEMVPASHIFVVVNQEHAELAAQQLPELPVENILCEPAGRGTAACLAFAAHILEREDPHAVMIALASDLVIPDKAPFQHLLQAGADLAAREEAFVLLGATPTHPATNLGYIGCAEPVDNAQGVPVYRVARFVEKPDAATADALLQTGQYFWNCGIFVWRVDHFWREMAEHLPAYAAAFRSIPAWQHRRELPSLLAEVYSGLTPVTIDYGLIEKSAQHCIALALPFTWHHVGDWEAIGVLLPQDASGNAAQARHVSIDTAGSIIIAENANKIIATIGVEDLVIVDTPDALLVMDKHRAQETRRILQEIQRMDG